MTTPNFPKAEYPGYDSRHHASGDLNPPSLQPGLPTDPAALPALRRRVFLGRHPAIGYPQQPNNAAYPIGTTLIGHGEEITSDAENRALYDAHRCIDAIAERERFPSKLLRHTGASILTNVYWDLAAFDPTGGGPPVPLSNDHLVFLGPLGTLAADAKRYITPLQDGNPVRGDGMPALSLVEDVLTALGGVTLYPLANPGAVDFFPADGASGTLTNVALTDITCTGSVDTSTNLIARCIYNYSLSTRIAQDSPQDLWKAFAICIAQAGGPGNPATMNHDVQADGWATGDIVYFTPIALAPTLRVTYTAPVLSGQTSVLSGGWDRVQNGEGIESVREAIAIAQARDWNPCIEVGLAAIPTPVFSWDFHDAMIRTRLDYQAGLMGYVAVDRIDMLGNSPSYAAFTHLQAMLFPGPRTQLYAMPWNQFTFAGPTSLTLTTFGTQWATPGPFAVTDVIPYVDLVEIYEDNGGAWPDPGRCVGVWLVTSIPGGGAGTTANVIRLDGDAIGTGMPPAGYLRVVRPVMRQGSFISGVDDPLNYGLRLIGQYNNPGLTHIGLDNADIVEQVLEAPLPARLLTKRREVRGDGSTHTRARSAGYCFYNDGEDAFFHSIAMSAGEEMAWDPGGGPVIPLCHLYEEGGAGTFRAAWHNDNVTGVNPEDNFVYVSFPLNLPDGALVTLIRATFKHDDPGLPGVPAWLALVKHADNAVGETSYLATSLLTVTPDTVTLTDATAPTPLPGGGLMIDNSFTHHLTVGISKWNDGKTLWIIGLRVYYQLTRLLPA